MASIGNQKTPRNGENPGPDNPSQLKIEPTELK